MAPEHFDAKQPTCLTSLNSSAYREPDGCVRDYVGAVEDRNLSYMPIGDGPEVSDAPEVMRPSNAASKCRSAYVGMSAGLAYIKLGRRTLSDVEVSLRTHGRWTKLLRGVKTSSLVFAFILRIQMRTA